MKSPYYIAFLMTLVVAGTYWYKSTAAECPAPISYRLGELDKSFDISPAEALGHIKEAELLWEESVGRELFTYDESAEFTIDFIFDERQAVADSEELQRGDLDDQRNHNETVLQSVESLQADYEALSNSYQSKVDIYEENLAVYNTEVNKYNDRGGAPPDAYESLGEQRDDLAIESESLSDLANDLNSLVQEINRLSEKGNKLVDIYNREVVQYNQEFGFAREFTQGDYRGNQIHIYKFSTEAELVTVLAHEFGHALGIGHVEGESSLMYYLLADTETVPVLSPTDLTAYQAVCGMTESYEQKVRRIIRELLAKFK